MQDGGKIRKKAKINFFPFHQLLDSKSMTAKINVVIEQNSERTRYKADPQRECL